MKKYLFILAAAATVLAACTKELKEITNETAEETQTGLTFIQAFCEDGIDSKALINDTSAVFTWSTGDQIAVFSGGTYYVSQELPATYNDKASAGFSFDDDIDSGRSDFAVYPASLVHNGMSPITASVNKHTAAELSVKFPKTYELAQLQGEQSPAPRIAVNAPGQGLQFKSICAILRVTVRSVSKNCDYLTIKFPGKKVNGEFVMTDFVAGTGYAAGAASTKESEQMITVTELGCNKLYYADSLVLNIPVPVGEYTDIEVTAYDEDSEVINKMAKPVKRVASVPTAWTPGRKSAAKVGVSLPCFTLGTTLKSANINNPSHLKVLFAPGNLRARMDTVPTVSTTITVNTFGTADKWEFAEHQWEAIGDSKPDPATGRTASYNSLQEPQVGDWIDLFSWMGQDATGANVPKLKAGQKYGISYPSNSSAGGWYGTTKVEDNPNAVLWFDWGHNVISHGETIYPADFWHTPGANGLENVLQYRNKGGKAIDTACKGAILDGTDTLAFGMIILPDRFELPYGVRPLAYVWNNGRTWSTTGNHWTVNSTYHDCAICSDNAYSLEDWQKLEAAGCVFLPLTNSRKLVSSKGTTNFPGDAWYWSDFAYGSNNYALVFNYLPAGASDYSSSSSSLQARKSRARYIGCAVRLVRDLN
ncbi:MAG: hypothetical protein J5771_05080 [Bacteroidales bacterium]|nr:hypothetical protein [Bacteroidales bacterium]